MATEVFDEPRFEYPPPIRRPSPSWSKWDVAAALLRSKPGEWAWIGSGAGQRGDSAGVARALGAEFEVTQRTVDGEGRIYARYVGEQ